MNNRSCLFFICSFLVTFSGLISLSLLALSCKNFNLIDHRSFENKKDFFDLTSVAGPALREIDAEFERQNNSNNSPDVAIAPITNTKVLTQILALPLKSFIGKPVDSLLIALPTGHSNRGFMPLKIGRSKGISQGYGVSDNNYVFVQIFIDTFHYMTFPNYSPITSWNLNLAKQETVAFIKVWKNNECVYGCTSDIYSD